MNCACKWDGNLDGKLRRCAAHQARYLLERKARKAAARAYEEVMNDGS